MNKNQLLGVKGGIDTRSRQARLIFYVLLNHNECVLSSICELNLGNLRTIRIEFTNNQEIIATYSALKKPAFIKDRTKNPEDRQRIENMFVGLGEDNNPVVLKYKLKKKQIMNDNKLNKLDSPEPHRSLSLLKLVLYTNFFEIIMLILLFINIKTIYLL